MKKATETSHALHLKPFFDHKPNRCKQAHSRNNSFLMAEFGAKLCSNPGCLQHDFLPFTCSACSRVFCLQHFAISAHACAEGEAYLASRRDEGGNATCSAYESSEQIDDQRRSNPPPSSSKPSEVMAAVKARFDGREGELNGTVTHYNIKASEGDGEEVAGAPDKLLKNSQKAVDRAATVKGKRVSTQVHRMLLKSKAVGDKNLRMEDRFFLEVHYCGNDTDVHHLFFSRMWTVGRALDDIVATRRRYLRLEPGDGGRSLELAREDSSSGLPAGGILGNLATRLQSFDVVIVRPRRPPAPSAAAGTAAAEGSAAIAVSGLETAGRPVDKPAPSSEEEAAVLRTQTGMGGGVSEGGGSGLALPKDGDAPREGAADEVGLSVSPGEAPTGNSAPEERGMTITIGHGKAVYHLAGVLPDRSVLDIKRRLEPLTGVPFMRQKLVFKGILRDADLIGSTKVVEGAKVMLLGAPAAKK